MDSCQILGFEVCLFSCPAAKETVKFFHVSDRRDPLVMIVADMVPRKEGTWLFHCHVNEHYMGGMVALFTSSTVSDRTFAARGQSPLLLPRRPTERTNRCPDRRLTQWSADRAIDNPKTSGGFAFM